MRPSTAVGRNLFGGSETVALTWSVLLAFVRLTTTPQLVARPFEVEAALDVVDGWLARPNVVVIHPTDRHSARARRRTVFERRGLSPASPGCGGPTRCGHRVG